MPTLAESRSARLPDRVLAVAVPVLVVVFVVAPRVVAARLAGTGFAGDTEMRDALAVAFGAYWDAGGRALTPELAAVVDYWHWYHVVKAVVAAIQLVVLAVALARVWRAWARPAWARRAAAAPLAATGLGATALAVLALTALAANVQGALAPLASLLPLLTDRPSAASAAVLDQVRSRLDRVAEDGTPAPPALDALITDFARYHTVMVAVAVVAAAALLAVTALLWRRCARTDRGDRRARRLLAGYAVLTAVLTVGALIVAGANATTAAEPVPALSAFFDGGW
ncbi:hypothetical protein ACFYTF_27855 [Nocardia thailandica]|uniref:Tat (Twin-arginine translocation) pathway signal sequence n=1 Tax=Nocardia thailandica TaxID=257275 RepID=A0ABW6PW94_9NOCA